VLVTSGAEIRNDIALDRMLISVTLSIHTSNIAGNLKVLKVEAGS